jgi:hypothetical protein
MNPGFSVGHFITVGQLAWNVYRRCKNASNEYREASEDLANLHVIIKDVTETILSSNVTQHQEACLDSLSNECRALLTEFEALLDKRKSLGSRSRTTWDRLKWDGRAVSALRARVSSSIEKLTVFNLSVSKCVVIHPSLRLILEIRTEAYHITAQFHAVPDRAETQRDPARHPGREA